MARKPRAQQGEEAAKAAEQAQQGEEDIPSDLAGFLTWAQRAHVDEGVVLVALAHPDVREARTMEGTYSGFSVAPGDPAARWSDGSTYSEMPPP